MKENMEKVAIAIVSCIAAVVETVNVLISNNNDNGGEE